MRGAKQKLRRQFGLWGAIRRIHLYLAVEVAQLLVDQWSDLRPFETAIPATQRGKRDAVDTPPLRMRDEGVETTRDVRQPGWRPPMILGWEVYDYDAARIVIRIRLTQSDLSAGTTRGVVVEHWRVSLAECHGYPFAHDAHAIDRVHQRLGMTGEKVSDKRFEHGGTGRRLVEE